MFNSVLVVCVGNICRSPMGESLLKHRSASAGASVAISSAGLGALVGQGADPLAMEVMSEHGLDITPHRARQLDESMVRHNELILVMELWQQGEIERHYPFARGRVHLMGKWSEMEISDPYRKPKQAFIEAYEKIAHASEEWGNRLW